MPAPTLREQHTIAVDGEFINVTRQAMLEVAIDKMAFDYSSTDRDLALAEIGLSQQMINNPEATIKRKVYVLAALSPLEAWQELADNLIVDFVRDNWLALAGYNGTIPPEAP